MTEVTTGYVVYDGLGFSKENKCKTALYSSGAWHRIGTAVQLHPYKLHAHFSRVCIYSSGFFHIDKRLAPRCAILRKSRPGLWILEKLNFVVLTSKKNLDIVYIHVRLPMIFRRRGKGKLATEKEPVHVVPEKRPLKRNESISSTVQLAANFSLAKSQNLPAIRDRSCELKDGLTSVFLTVGSLACRVGRVGTVSHCFSLARRCRRSFLRVYSAVVLFFRIVLFYVQYTVFWYHSDQCSTKLHAPALSPTVVVVCPITRAETYGRWLGYPAAMLKLARCRIPRGFPRGRDRQTV